MSALYKLLKRMNLLYMLAYQFVAWVFTRSVDGCSLIAGLANFLFLRYLGSAPTVDGMLYEAGPGSFVGSRFLFLRAFVNATNGPSFLGNFTCRCFCFLP